MSKPQQLLCFGITTKQFILSRAFFSLPHIKSFNYKNLYEYTLLYNHTDTLLLAEIIMVYRKVNQGSLKMDVNPFYVLHEVDGRNEMKCWKFIYCMEWMLDCNEMVD